MASVRMTNELRIDIRQNAERAYELANPCLLYTSDAADE